MKIWNSLLSVGFGLRQVDRKCSAHFLISNPSQDFELPLKFLYICVYIHTHIYINIFIHTHIYVYKYNNLLRSFSFAYMYDFRVSARTIHSRLHQPRRKDTSLVILSYLCVCDWQSACTNYVSFFMIFSS